MGFLNKKKYDSLAYFAILGDLSSGLSFTVSFFKTLNFPLLFRGIGSSFVVVWPKRNKWVQSGALVGVQGTNFTF